MATSGGNQSSVNSSEKSGESKPEVGEHDPKATDTEPNSTSLGKQPKVNESETASANNESENASANNESENASANTSPKEAGPPPRRAAQTSHVHQTDAAKTIGHLADDLGEIASENLAICLSLGPAFTALLGAVNLL